MPLQISATEARRIALTAQGFNGATRDTAPQARQMRRAVDHLGVLQVDSVNVLVRAHYMPLYARLGPYDAALLDKTLGARPRRYFEYWGHEASILPMALQPLLRWRMDRADRGEGTWGQLRRFATSRRPEAMALLHRIRTEGPLAASDISQGKSGSGMWVWSEAKHMMEWLFWAGHVAATHRRGSFERVYDLPERVYPRATLDAPTPSEREAMAGLLAQAGRALGIATAIELRDYYRLPAGDVADPLQDLVEAGTLIPAQVEGWSQPAYLHHAARAGRKLTGATLLSPFDPLVWHRDRTERMFGFRYRLEIYTPAAKREYGYYVLPFLMDGQLVARVDLKADRKAGDLLVQSLHLEPGAPAETRARLETELHVMASWQGLERVVHRTAIGTP